MGSIDPKSLIALCDVADAVIYTDHNGHVRQVVGRFRDPEGVASAVDLIAAATSSLRDGCQPSPPGDFGELETLLISFNERVVAIAHTQTGHVAVFAASSVTPGLLLNRLRRLQRVADESSPPSDE